MKKLSGDISPAIILSAPFSVDPCPSGDARQALRATRAGRTCSPRRAAGALAGACPVRPPTRPDPARPCLVRGTWSCWQLGCLPGAAQCPALGPAQPGDTPVSATDIIGRDFNAQRRPARQTPFFDMAAPCSPSRPRRAAPGCLTASSAGLSRGLQRCPQQCPQQWPPAPSIPSVHFSWFRVAFLPRRRMT